MIRARHQEMVDEFSLDGSGWARFSLDGKRRFRLARSLVPGVSIAVEDHRATLLRPPDGHVLRIVFLMLNPSTANAFRVDPTVGKCMKFAQRWGAHVLEVANLFAFRSPDPKDLDIAHARAQRPPFDLGFDEDANLEILAACAGASRVIAGWGNNGTRWGRDVEVVELLQSHGIALECLGLTGESHPLHPLARGKKFISLDRSPIRLSPPKDPA